jgi:hypothetical protein
VKGEICNLSKGAVLTKRVRHVTKVTAR